jgi:hypothetical protein
MNPRCALAMCGALMFAAAACGSNDGETRGHQSAAPTVYAGALQSLEDAAFGISFSHPADWVAGAPYHPYAYCGACLVVGPASVAYPYGISLFEAPLHSFPGCTPQCYNSIRAVNAGPVTERRLDDRRARRQEMDKQAPLGLASETGDYTPYREIWTVVDRDDRVLIIVGFYRHGDAEGEARVRPAYDELLASLRLGTPQTTPIPGP